MLNSRHPGLIGRGTIYFVQNDTNIILPGDSDRRASCRARATHIWRQINRFKAQNVAYIQSLNSSLPALSDISLGREGSGTGITFDIFSLFLEVNYDNPTSRRLTANSLVLSRTEM